MHFTSSNYKYRLIIIDLFQEKFCAENIISLFNIVQLDVLNHSTLMKQKQFRINKKHCYTKEQLSQMHTQFFMQQDLYIRYYPPPTFFLEVSQKEFSSSLLMYTALPQRCPMFNIRTACHISDYKNVLNVVKYYFKISFDQ